MNAIKIGPYTYRIVKREGRRMLLSWIESATGIERELWVIVKDQSILRQAA